MLSAAVMVSARPAESQIAGQSNIRARQSAAAVKVSVPPVQSEVARAVAMSMPIEIAPVVVSSSAVVRAINHPSMHCLGGGTGVKGQ